MDLADVVPELLTVLVLTLGCSSNLLGDDRTVSDPGLNSQPVLWIQLKLAATSTALLTPLRYGGAGAGWQRPGTAGLGALLGVWLPLLNGAAGF